MSLLKLSTELLDEVFSYLDWDRTQHLNPYKTDVINASLACKQLRHVLIPRVFRDVTLTLCWERGAVLEPGLFRHRRDHPRLFQHIKVVCIRTELEQCLHCIAEADRTPFVVPVHLPDWLNPSNNSPDPTTEDILHRERADALARRRVPASLCSTGLEGTATAEDLIRLADRSSQPKHVIDTLSIAMLCVPATTRTIIFKSLPDGVHDTRNDFALKTLAAALELMGDRLQGLSITSTMASNLLGMSTPHPRRGRVAQQEDSPISADLIRGLNISRLAFALNDRFSFQETVSIFAQRDLSCWHQAAHSIRHLELRHLHAGIDDLLQFVKGFNLLSSVRIQDSILALPNMARPPNREELEQRVWLSFAIELRQAMADINIEFRNLQASDQWSLPQSAVEWIMRTVPVRARIDADREERLLQDFGSFLPLWCADDGARGLQALGEWAKQRGPLSDQAMSRRWR